MKVTSCFWRNNLREGNTTVQENVGGSITPVASNAYICAPAPFYAPVEKGCLFSMTGSDWPITSLCVSVSSGVLAGNPSFVSNINCGSDWPWKGGFYKVWFAIHQSLQHSFSLSPTVAFGFFLLSSLLFFSIFSSPLFIFAFFRIFPSLLFEVLLSHFSLSCFLLMFISSASLLPASQAHKNKQTN